MIEFRECIDLDIILVNIFQRNKGMREEREREEELVQPIMEVEKLAHWRLGRSSSAPSLGA